MSTADERKKTLRTLLKRLRAERGDHVKSVIAANAPVRAERKKIVAAMADASMSVPQLATATELPTDRVLWHVAAMRKYGKAVETTERDGDYFMYALVAGTPRGAAKTDDDGGES